MVTHRYVTVTRHTCLTLLIAMDTNFTKKNHVCAYVILTC